MLKILAAFDIKIQGEFRKFILEFKKTVTQEKIKALCNEKKSANICQVLNVITDNECCRKISLIKIITAILYSFMKPTAPCTRMDQGPFLDG